MTFLTFLWQILWNQKVGSRSELLILSLIRQKSNSFERKISVVRQFLGYVKIRIWEITKCTVASARILIQITLIRSSPTAQVSVLTLVVESVYPVDGRALVVAAQQKKVLGIFYLKNKFYRIIMRYVCDHPLITLTESHWIPPPPSTQCCGAGAVFFWQEPDFHNFNF